MTSPVFGQEAEIWYRRAAKAGDTNAMFHLGAVLERRGERQEAEIWYQRVVDAGYADAVSRARQLR